MYIADFKNIDNMKVACQKWNRSSIRENYSNWEIFVVSALDLIRDESSASKMLSLRSLIGSWAERDSSLNGITFIVFHLIKILENGSGRESQLFFLQQSWILKKMSKVFKEFSKISKFFLKCNLNFLQFSNFYGVILLIRRFSSEGA